MPFVATVTFVMYQKVCLLLDDIVVVAGEGDERCLGGPRMHRTPFHFSELYNSHFLNAEEVRHGDVTAGVKRAWNVITADKYSFFILRGILVPVFVKTCTGAGPVDVLKV